MPLQVQQNIFEDMGNDGSCTGTRNGRCSLPSSSRLGDVGVLPSGREEEGTAPMLLPVLTTNSRVWAMMAAMQAPEIDAVSCRTLHVLEMLEFCAVEEGRKKELLVCPFQVENNGFFGNVSYFF